MQKKNYARRHLWNLIIKKMFVQHMYAIKCSEL